MNRSFKFKEIIKSSASLTSKWSRFYEEEDDEINENLNNNSDKVVTLFDLPLTIQNCAEKIKTLNRIPIVVILSNRTVRVMAFHKHFQDVTETNGVFATIIDLNNSTNPMEFDPNSIFQTVSLVAI